MIPLKGSEWLLRFFRLVDMVTLDLVTIERQQGHSRCRRHWGERAPRPTCRPASTTPGTPCTPCSSSEFSRRPTSYPEEGRLPELSAVLAERYPDDQATGYAAGDLKGAIWAETPVR